MINYTKSLIAATLVLAGQDKASALPPPQNFNQSCLSISSLGGSLPKILPRDPMPIDYDSNGRVDVFLSPHRGATKLFLEAAAKLPNKTKSDLDQLVNTVVDLINQHFGKYDSEASEMQKKLSKAGTTSDLLIIESNFHKEESEMAISMVGLINKSSKLSTHNPLRRDVRVYIDRFLHDQGIDSRGFTENKLKISLLEFSVARARSSRDLISKAYEINKLEMGGAWNVKNADLNDVVGHTICFHRAVLAAEAFKKCGIDARVASITGHAFVVFPEVSRVWMNTGDSRKVEKYTYAGTPTDIKVGSKILSIEAISGIECYPTAWQGDITYKFRDAKESAILNVLFPGIFRQAQSAREVFTKALRK